MELKPTARTEQTFKYDIPRDGNVVQSITIAASSNSCAASLALCSLRATRRGIFLFLDDSWEDCLLHVFYTLPYVFILSIYVHFWGFYLSTTV